MVGNGLGVHVPLYPHVKVRVAASADTVAAVAASAAAASAVALAAASVASKPFRPSGSAVSSAVRPPRPALCSRQRRLPSLTCPVIAPRLSTTSRTLESGLPPRLPRK